ncbi:hypothetical protein DXD67_10535 [Coprococcus comes]|uniref:Uncharacterized protein n=1 Tax=Coprococcus comes TaxID=410072 RepID=A0A3E4GNU7_9FIRM|nr:hypothetical protein [Coprococcus comes]RGJ22391.1 hypothetical protein DXD67_10535 [Coprococcus comes]
MNINNSKYIVYAFNKKWKSIRECCKYYEVRYGSVMSYKRIHKCTAEEAIAYCRNLKKLGIFYFKKVRWTDLCKFRFIGSPIPLATDQCFRS